MKVTENKPHSIHLRLTDEQYQFLKADSEMLGVGVSDYVRMIVNTTMYATKNIANRMQAKLGDLENADNQNYIKHQL